MKNTQLSSELKNLIAEKSNVCVSLVIPLHQMPLFKKIDSLVVDHAIRKLQALMSPRYDAPLVKEFIEKVKYLKDDIRYINGVKGIGIFMSENTFYTTTFPFEVQERIHAAVHSRCAISCIRNFICGNITCLDSPAPRSIYSRGTAVRLPKSKTNTFLRQPKCRFRQCPWAKHCLNQDQPLNVTNR